MELILEIPVSLRDIEKKVVLGTLSYYEDSRMFTSKALGMSLRTLHRRLRQYSLEDFGDAKHYYALKNSNKIDEIAVEYDLVIKG